MKITIKNKLQESSPIELKNIKPGMVFEFEEGAIAVKGGLCLDDAFLLSRENGSDDWFERVQGMKTNPIKRILGKLVEIVVEEI